MLTNSDKERFNSIMEKVMEKRLLRTSVPERDEEKIAEILRRAEQSAAEEHARLVETINQNGGYIGNTNRQETVSQSQEKSDFSGMARMKKRFQKTSEES